MTDLAAGPPRERRAARPARPRPLRLTITSPAGLRSPVWTVSPSREADRRISIAPQRCSWTTTHTSWRGGWRVEVPGDTGERHGLADLRPAPDLGQQLDTRASGWHVGLVLLIPTCALAPAASPVGAGVRAVPAPEPGRCTQITVLLCEPHAAGLTIAGSRRGDGLLAHGDGFQVWKGQAALPPTTTRHLLRVRRHLAGVAPPEPGGLPAFTRFRTPDDVDVVADLGLV